MARVGVNRMEFLLENLRRELDMVQSTLKGLNTDVVSLGGSGATKVLTAADSGAIVKMGGSDASTVTLQQQPRGLSFVLLQQQHMHTLLMAVTARFKAVITITQTQQQLLALLLAINLL